MADTWPKLAEFENGVRESCDKLARPANQHFVGRLRSELIAEREALINALAGAKMWINQEDQDADKIIASIEWLLAKVRAS